MENQDHNVGERMEDGILNLSAHGDNENVFDQNPPFDDYQAADDGNEERSEEHTSELQSQ